jgi:L-alanine-DL-glutamate epimerase-like enolase superfamily enzyme
MPHKPLQIAHIDVIAIRAQRKEVVRSASGTNTVNASEFGIIRIVADNGCEGLGEISLTFPQVGFSLCHAARRWLAPKLLGLDPRALPQALRVIDSALAGELSAPYLRAAFEMALLDLAGRYYDVPVYQLLGGKAREAVPLAWGIYQKSPEEMAADARAGLAEGFHAIKLKVGRALGDDMAAVRAVTQAVPGVPLRLDANMAWRTVPEAARAIRALAETAPIAWVEQPLRRDNLAGLRLLRRQCGVTIMADESVQTLRDAHAAATAEAADVFNIYVVEAGGLKAAADIFAFAGALDIPCIIGSQAEMGIGTAACAHLGVAVADLPYACETFGPLRYTHDIVSRTPRIERGFLYPPDGAGLGVRLDEDAVKDFQVDF